MPNPSLRRLWTIPVLAAGLLLPLVAAAPAEAADRTTSTEARRVDRVRTPRLHWERDRAGSGYSATVRLPLDYDEPAGATVGVALYKVPAGDPTQRIGTLFLNPGGPGGSGVAMARSAAEFLSPVVLARFDIVGFDPRGTNASTRVRCFGSTGSQASAIAGLGVPFPATLSEEQAYLASGRNLATGCSGYGKAVASAVSTAEVARDLDVLRRAVGDRKLNYLGFSYGSYLGQVYANLFPDRVRAVALDGVLNPVAWAGDPADRSVPTTLRLKSAEASWKALTAGLAACAAAGPPACPLANPQADFDVVAARLKRGPIKVGTAWGNVDYGYRDFLADVLDMLYSPSGMESVADLVAVLRPLATSPNPAGLSAQGGRLSELLGAVHKATATPAPAASYDSGLEAYSAVLCTDSIQPSDPASWPRAIRSAAAKAPHFAQLWGWSDVQCATRYWKASDEDSYRGSFRKWTVAPVLFVGNYHDPATGYSGALEAKALLPRSYLVRSDSWGHTAYGTSACVTDRVDAYLLRLAKPAGSVCVGDVQPFQAEPTSSAARQATSTARQATASSRPPVPTRAGLPPVTPPWVSR